ncbi:hypothetical protein EX895_005341 [Sporisorium graminicola]|uniref:RanBD1 domain-containing protein n=1 Tax=Sporisorium graminicola TaxID=280036 RepID=A0A4U7KN91_9BASI|nr:hypothetical protein EX895_005341 [Sporisorium graminicola]TKY85800.1 hypothetical protein EX895_005341 [Sporisorium graminicola]
MGPSRHTRATAASAGAPSNRNVDSTPASPSKTPVRPSPYARTPTKPSASSALTLGPSTPTSRTSSPMMLREIFSMISPFRGLSRARRSAAFGAADEMEADQDTSTDEHIGQTLEKVQETVDDDDRMIEDAEQGASIAEVPTPSQNAPSSHLDAPPSDTRSALRSSSPRPRSSLAAPPPKSLPLADSSLVTPGLRRHFANAPSSALSSTPAPSISHAPPTQTSPVSRNYDLLARFFSEKQRGGQGGLTEVEVEGCIRLIEESMASGRNLESEFASSGSLYGRSFPAAQTSGFAPSSSRASSIAPPALPSSQSMNTLFHPGANRLPASSSAYSFLAPRAPAPRSAFGAAPSTTRRRPIYLGPGMSGLSLNRRRPVVASASRAAALAKTASFMPRSSTDPDLAGLVRQAGDSQEFTDRSEAAKRRRTGVDAANAVSSAPALGSTTDQTVQFEPSYEKEARQSSLLAKDIAASTSSTHGSSGSPLKRAAPSAEIPANKTSPPKATTRTASAIQDILKTTPPVRPPTKPELVNPYQSAAPLAAKSKSPAEADSTKTTPVRHSARTSMLTRAKARETARAAEKLSPPKESVLDLIERTAPKTINKRKPTTEAQGTQQTDKALAPNTVASAAENRPSVEERKQQKTEEVQRRLEALNKSKSQQQQEQPQQSVPKPAVADAKSAKVSANLVPPQYTATKPKKPSPLSAAFQAPDSPGSDSEAAAPVQPRGPAISRPSFSFGSPASANAAKPATPSTGFSFSAPKATANSHSDPAAASSSDFSFSKPAASASAPAQPASSAAPAPTVPSFSFSPVAAAPKPAASTTPASAGFSFSVPSSATTSSSSASNSTSAVTSSTSSSVRSQVLAEDASTLPKFDWQTPSISAPADELANQALRDEIKSVAQAALPKFDFIYDIETSADGSDKGSSGKAVAPSAGFGFSASAQASPAPASGPATTSVATDAATSNISASEDASPDPSTDDASKSQSSGLLGEGEGEESERTLLEVRAKIWRLDMESKSWKDLGVCIAKIKHDSATGKHRLLARNEANGKVAVNFMLYKGLKSSLDKTVNAFLGFDGKEPTQYRMKVKTQESAEEFKEALEGAAGKA